MAEKQTIIPAAQRMSKMLREELANIDESIALHSSEVRRLILERTKLSAALVGIGDYGMVLTGNKFGHEEIDDDTRKIAGIVGRKD